MLGVLGFEEDAADQRQHAAFCSFGGLVKFTMP